MLYREIIAVCSQIHTKHTNTLCGQNVELLNVSPVAMYSKCCYQQVYCGMLLYTLVQNYRPFNFSARLIASFSRLSTNSTEYSSVIFSSKHFCLSTSSDRNIGRDLSPPRSANCELLPTLFSVHQSLLLTSRRFLRILDISDIDALWASGWM
jgi:hypothetical protein